MTTRRRPPSPLIRYPQAGSGHVLSSATTVACLDPIRRNVAAGGEGDGHHDPLAPTQHERVKASTGVDTPAAEFSNKPVARPERYDEGGWETPGPRRPSGRALHIHRPCRRRASDQSRERPDEVHLDTGRTGAPRKWTDVRPSLRVDEDACPIEGQGLRWQRSAGHMIELRGVGFEGAGGAGWITGGQADPTWRHACPSDSTPGAVGQTSGGSTTSDLRDLSMRDPSSTLVSLDGGAPPPGEAGRLLLPRAGGG